MVKKRIDEGRRSDFPGRLVDALETSDEVQRALVLPHSHTHREKGSDPTEGSDNQSRLLGAYIGF